jgi:hypothetical protein
MGGEMKECDKGEREGRVGLPSLRMKVDKMKEALDEEKGETVRKKNIRTKGMVI